MSNSLDPDQDRHIVGPDLGQNGLQSLSADDKSLLARKELILRHICHIIQHSVGPDLGRNCLQRLSADDKSRQ